MVFRMHLSVWVVYRLLDLAGATLIPVGRQLMNQVANTTILHFYLLDLLVLILVVPVGAALIKLALCFPVVSFPRARRLLLAIYVLIHGLLVQ